jgi:hypothetical protein
MLMNFLADELSVRGARSPTIANSKHAIAGSNRQAG